MSDKVIATVVVRETFVEGDVICSMVSWTHNLPIFFRATDYDVEHYSSKNGEYLVIVPL